MGGGVLKQGFEGGDTFVHYIGVFDLVVKQQEVSRDLALEIFR